MDVDVTGFANGDPDLMRNAMISILHHPNFERIRVIRQHAIETGAERAQRPDTADPGDIVSDEPAGVPSTA